MAKHDKRSRHDGHDKDARHDKATRHDKRARPARRKHLLAQAAWAYQCAGQLLMAPSTYRTESARERAREWLLDVLADTASGRRARVGLIAYSEAFERGRIAS